MTYRIQGRGGDLWWTGEASDREDAVRRAREENRDDPVALDLIAQADCYQSTGELPVRPVESPDITKAIVCLTNKDLQDAFLEGFEYAEDIGHTNTKKLVAEAMRRYPEPLQVDHTIMSKHEDHRDGLD